MAGAEQMADRMRNRIGGGSAAMMDHRVRIVLLGEHAGGQPATDASSTISTATSA